MATKLSGNQDVDIFKDEKDGKLREVGNQAVWSLSSCKPGTTVVLDLLRISPLQSLMYFSMLTVLSP